MESPGQSPVYCARNGLDSWWGELDEAFGVDVGIEEEASDSGRLLDMGSSFSTS